MWKDFRKFGEWKLIFLSSQINYLIVIDRKKYHRFNYRKDKLVREGYDENLSEHEIMLNRKIYRIYDSGSLKFNKLFSLKIISQSQDGAKKQSIN